MTVSTRTRTNMGAMQYATGDWYVVAKENGFVLLPGHVAVSTLEGVWSALDTGRIAAVIDAMTAGAGSPLSGIPPFTIAINHGADMRVAVRGDVRVVYDDGSRQELITGGRMETWVEQEIPAHAALLVTPPESQIDETLLPLVSGIARAGLVAVGTQDRPGGASTGTASVAPSASDAAAIGAPAGAADSSGVAGPHHDADAPAHDTDASAVDSAGPARDADVPAHDADAPAHDADASVTDLDASTVDSAGPDADADAFLADADASAMDLADTAVGEPYGSAPDPLAAEDLENADAGSAADAATHLASAEPHAPAAAADVDEAANAGADAGADADADAGAGADTGAGGEASSSPEAVASTGQHAIILEESRGDHDGHTVEQSFLQAARAAGLVPDTDPDAAQAVSSDPDDAADFFAELGIDLTTNDDALPGDDDALRGEDARRSLGRVVLSTGVVLDLDRPLLVGRRPRIDQSTSDDIPELITVASPTHDISRNHVEIRRDGESVTVTDLNTTNGTMLLRDGDGPLRLHPGEPTVVISGDVLDIGDEVTLAFEDIG